MKKIILISFFLLSYLSFSQVYTVYDTQKNEIYGYLVFELSEKISKKEYVYSTTLLDVDSQKQKETTFSDYGKIRIGNVLYNGTSIYFEVLPEDTEDDTTIGTNDYSYRIYNLNSNTISSKFELAEQHKKTHVVASYPIQNTGFGLILNNSKTNVNQFFAVSDNNELLYDAYPFGNPGKKKQTEEILVGDTQGDLLVTINKKAPRGKNKKAYTSLLFLNAKSGDTIKETVLDSEKYKIDLNAAKIVGDDVWAFGDAFGKKKSINSGKVEGLVKTTLDLEGNIKEQKEVAWEDLKPIVKIKKGGKKKGKGLMHTHDFVVDKNTNHVIMVGEYLKGSRSRIKVKDMYFMDFDADFNLTQLYEVKTKTSTLYINDIKAKGARQYGAIVKEHKYFDYKFHNQIDNGLSFYYFNTEKKGFLGGKKIPQGVVIYKDGTFNSAPLTWEKRTWKSEKLNLLPSKAGYILTSKISENKVEANLHPIEITTVEVIETENN